VACAGGEGDEGAGEGEVGEGEVEGGGEVLCGDGQRMGVAWVGGGGGFVAGGGLSLGKEGGERYRGRSLCGGEAWRILQGEGQGRGS